MTARPPISRPRPASGFVLRFRYVVALAAVLIAFAAALAYWTGTYDPQMLHGFSVPWPDPTMEALCVLAGSALILVPMFWVWKKRTIDYLALVLPLEAINLFAYFAISATAYKIPKEANGILQMAGLLLMLNAVGFCILLASCFASYKAAGFFRGRLPALAHPQELLDRRMQRVLRIGGCLCVLLIIAPMIYIGSIPLFAGGGDSRVSLVVEDPLRAGYNFAETIFPFLVGGLAVILFRKPRRIAGIDGLIFLALLAVQVLSTDRSAFLFAMMAVVVLLSMEKRWPRWLLLLIFTGYISFFTVFAGFSALMRTNADKLKSGAALAASIEETFMGDNVIDLHDGAWVLSHWDFEPLLGKTYLGGAFSMMPSGLFPQKKEWHLGLTALRIVGWSEADIEKHFGLRISFFGESFLNFGAAGVVTLAVVLGMFFGAALRLIHLAAAGA
ncbi:MAG TPA: O-antigen polymerase, partial [Candidatus Methylacidiphilales bacterium]